MTIFTNGVSPSSIKPSATNELVEGGSFASSKDEYRVFCLREVSVPLFSRSWWLDEAVGPHGWDVALVKKGNLIVASLPYVIRRRCGMKILTQPSLTPYLGPWIRPCVGKVATQVSNDSELMQALIDQLHPFDHFGQMWHPNVKNWQPFFWNGFSQTTYYTYVLSDLADARKLWAGLDSRARRAINKAEKHRLHVRGDLPLETLLELNRKTFARQGLVPPESDEFIRRIDAACTAHNCRKIIILVDANGKPASGEYLVWDQDSAYSLLSGTDPAYRNSGANSLCVWEAIQYASGVTRQFNFCGSMMKSVEAYVRSFGGLQVPYSRLTKTPSRILEIYQGIISAVRGK